MRHHQKPGVEGLELRRMLAATFDAATKTLVVTGSNASETIAVLNDFDRVKVTIGAITQQFPFATNPVTSVKVFALDGNDVVSFESPTSAPLLKATIDLGSGNDKFGHGGIISSTGVTILGGAGNDSIIGTNFPDRIDGGDGDDSLEGGASIDTIIGGNGTDTAKYDGLDSLSGIENKITLKSSTRVENGTLIISGTEGADFLQLAGPSYPIINTNGADYYVQDDSGTPVFPAFTRLELRGLGGDDRVWGLESRFSSPVLVVLDGGSGNDSFVIDDFAASVVCGSGDDFLLLDQDSALLGFSDSGGVDTIDARNWWPGGGYATLDLRKYPSIENALNATSIIGNDLGNILIVSNYNDSPATVSGGKGDDIIKSNAFRGLLDGGDGNDFLVEEGDRHNTLNGGSGTDTLLSGASATRLNGESTKALPTTVPLGTGTSGNITVTGSEGADVISVLAWRDEFPQSAAGMILVNKVPYLFYANSKLSIAITARGLGGNDKIEMRASGAGVRGIFEGGNGNDMLLGGSYDDSLYGGNNDDTLDGRGGADLMQGGAGSDLVDYSSRAASVTVGIGTLADDGEANERDNVYSDIEKVRGGKGNDKLTGSAANNVLYGGSGNDTLIGNGANDALFGEAGNDSLDGGDGADYLDGGSNNDILRGGAGVDQFFGYDGDDTFYSRDTLKETLNGGNGIDKAQRDAIDILNSVEGTLP